MNKQNQHPKTAISPTRSEDYAQWYQQVIVEASLAENSAVRGCMIIKPWAYAIWELMQKYLDQKFKQTGHLNAYFPLLIPLSYLQKEASHIDGFAKECAVVTHHRLISNESGELIPDGKLEEPFIIRPTSEMIIGESFAKWVKSYRDLPLLINQWANVMRWELRTRMFLRTSEFLWQEGHTAHATSQEAISHSLMMLDIYTQFVEAVLAIPVIKGEKPCFERFPGAINTYTIEVMTQDAKALQAGTSHFLGQNFSKASNIEFLDKDSQLKHAWTTSWGVTTRLIGALIMVHSDDNGLVLPPRIAPQQIILIPIYRNDTEEQLVMDYCNSLVENLNNQQFFGDNIRSFIDKRDIRGGEKKWQWIKKGVPLILEIGPRDVANEDLCMITRTTDINTKTQIKRAEFLESILRILTKVQNTLFANAKEYQKQRTIFVNSKEEFDKLINSDYQGFIKCYAVNNQIIDAYIKDFSITARCIPFVQTDLDNTLNPDYVITKKCIFTGQAVDKYMVFAKSY